MKIGFDFRMGGVKSAGIGRYSFELLCELLILSQNQHSWLVFYHPDNILPEEKDKLEKLGAKLILAPYKHYSWQEQILFPRLLYKYNLDLVHFPNFNVPIFYRRPFVTTIHDMVHHKISGHKKSTYWKFLLYKLVISKAAKNAKIVITVTDFAKQEIIKYLQIPAEKISVTPEAPSARIETDLNFDDVKADYNLTRPYLLFVGTLERKKNILGLVQGFNRFLDKYQFDLDLVIVGKIDKHYPEIKEQALQVKYADHLLFTGFASNQLQAAFYSNAFAFITASLHEGFGLPGLEAMQYGLPVLASNTEVFNEVYDNAAIYFNPLNPDDIADKINLIVNDAPFHQKMQHHSNNRVVLFSWKKTATLTLEIYKNIVNSLSKPSIEYEPEKE